MRTSLETPVDNYLTHCAVLGSSVRGCRRNTAFDQTWLSVLGRNLNRPETTRQYTVMAAGVAGSDPFYEYRLLVDKLLAYQPDLVMMVVNGSDVIDVIVRGGKERFLPNGRTRGGEPPSTIVTWLYKNSHFARFVLFEAFDYTHLMITRAERGRRAVEALEKIEALIVELDQRRVFYY